MNGTAAGAVTLVAFVGSEKAASYRQLTVDVADPQSSCRSRTNNEGNLKGGNLFVPGGRGAGSSGSGGSGSGSGS